MALHGFQQRIAIPGWLVVTGGRITWTSVYAADATSCRVPPLDCDRSSKSISLLRSRLWHAEYLQRRRRSATKSA